VLSSSASLVSSHYTFAVALVLECYPGGLRGFCLTNLGFGFFGTNGS